MSTPTIEITSVREDLIPGVREAVGGVAEERRFLLTVSKFSLEDTRRFVQMILDGGGVQFVALAGSRVVGWCDVVRHVHEGTLHVGELGMGVVPEFRRKGIGKRLLIRALEAAKEDGVERVELEVFSPNTDAIALYDKMGFVHEGRKMRARRIDDTESDILLMAKFL